MQKIKSVLQGNSSDSGAAGDRTSRDYSTGTSPTTDRLTGDAGVGNRASTGTAGLSTTGASGTNTTGTGSGLPNVRDSTATGATSDTPNTTSGFTGVSPTGATGNTEASRLTGDKDGYNTSSAGATGAGLGTAAAAGGATAGSRSGSGFLGGKHDHGHDTNLASKFDPSAETTHHDHKHLHHVTHRDVRHIETEEVTRQRDHERHIHHVQHHVQPVKHQEIQDEVHHEKSHPVTHIREQHVNTDEDHQLFRGLGEKHKDSESHRPKERTIVDRGETVNEKVHHHVHHVTQPVVEHEVHDRHRIHTIIPTSHVTHEAPIIHKSSMHEPISMEDFKKGGGVLGSGITMDKANVLQTGECSREVDGVGEKLAQELHLGSGSASTGAGSRVGGTTTGQTTSV